MIVGVSMRQELPKTEFLKMAEDFLGLCVAILEETKLNELRSSLSIAVCAYKEAAAELTGVAQNV